jgi:intracellular multiplication protein IcmK
MKKGTSGAGLLGVLVLSILLIKFNSVMAQDSPWDVYTQEEQTEDTGEREEFYFPTTDVNASASPSALPGGTPLTRAQQAAQDQQQGNSGSGEDLSLSGPFTELQDRDKTAEEIEAEIRAEAFDAALTGLLPMQPDEIRKLLEYYDKTRQAIETPIYPYPKPELKIETVALDPGSTPPEIHLAVNHVSTISFYDVTGAPWPIGDIAFAGEFEIAEPEELGHTMAIIPLAEFAHGNLAITLLTLPTPVVFTLKTQRDVVQYRYDARIPEFGPFAESPIIEGGIDLVAGSPLLNSILDGVPPEGAVKLEIAGVDGRTTAYSYNFNTYVRTPYTLLSPGWTNSLSSADGMNVYAVKNAPVLLLSDNGRMVRAHVSGGGTSR